MNVFPNGFLLDLHALVTPSSHQPGEGTFVDTLEGEFLLPPTLVEIVTRGEITEGTCFLGIDSLGGSTEAEVRMVNGPTYLHEVMVLARQFGADSEDEAAALDLVLKLSEVLRKLSQEGIRRVRRTAHTPGELLPVA